MASVKDHQYQDFLARPQDQYSNTKYRILLKYLRGRPPLHVLNAGCGSGELSLRLARAGHTVTGIDPVPEFIDLAQKNASLHASSRCSFQIASIEDFHAPRQFDCVVSTDVLEHIEDDVRAFRKLADVVKPGGTMLITVPACPWLTGYHDDSLGHYRRYTSTTLRDLVEPWCEVESLRHFGFTLIPVCYLYSRLLRRPYPISESGDWARRPLRAAILRAFLRLDKAVPAPLGISLVLKARRRA